MRAPTVVLAAAALALPASFSPLPARAQSSALTGARSALATYDVTGPTTLDALRSLGPVAGGGGSDALEARYLRAVAGTDLHVIALATGDTALDGRLADALGVAHDGVGAELRRELGAVESGLYRRVVVEERATLDEAERIAGGEVRVTGSGPRSAALFVLGVARATVSREALAAIHTSASAASARPAWLLGPDAGLEAPLQAALRAEAIATRGAHDGDPLVAALAGALSSAHATLTTFELHVPPSTASDATLTIAAADAAGGASPDVLLVVDATRVVVACAARAHVASATELAVTAVSLGCPEPGTSRSIALPSSLPAVPQPIDELVAALGALGLPSGGGGPPSGTTIGIAPTEAAPMHVVTRVLRSMARASLAPTHFALAAPDGTLTTSPLVLATAADAPPVTVHIRLGGYSFARVHGHDSQIPRIHGAHGLEPDHATLGTMAAAEGSGTAMAVDAMGTVPAAELVRTMRVLGAAGAHVTLALP